MIRMILIFLVLFAVFFIGIGSIRMLTARRLFKITSVLLQASIASAITIALLVILVVLF